MARTDHAELTDTDCENLPLEAGDTETAQSGAPIDLLEYLPLVRSIASRIYASIPPYASVELSDLMQAGHLGLVHASRSYQSGRKVPFAVYARFRIRGEILDSLRHIDTASRRMRRLDKQVKAATQNLTSDLQREPTEAEIRQKLQGELGTPNGKALDLTMLRLPAIAITSLDDADAGTQTWRANEAGPEDLHAQDEARQILKDALGCLPTRSRELVLLYYQGGLTMREIGDRFNVNESRISQIHRRALERMGRYLRSAGISSSREI